MGRHGRSKGERRRTGEKSGRAVMAPLATSFLYKTLLSPSSGSCFHHQHHQHNSTTQATSLNSLTHQQPSSALTPTTSSPQQPQLPSSNTQPSQWLPPLSSLPAAPSTTVVPATTSEFPSRSFPAARDLEADSKNRDDKDDEEENKLVNYGRSGYNK